MKLSISLPEEEVGFVDAYARSQGIKSRLASFKLHSACCVRRNLPTTTLQRGQNRMKRTIGRGTDHRLMV